MLKSDNYILPRNSFLLSLVALCAALSIVGPSCTMHAAPDTAEVQAAFGEDCETLLIKQIDEARSSIVVAIYSMTRRNISDALAGAVRRGVKVQLKYDAASAKNSEGDQMKKQIAFMKKKGVKCTAIEMPDGWASMHHKFAVIDEKVVVTGSYNFTSSATTANYENLVSIKSEDVAKAFKEEFDRIKSK